MTWGGKASVGGVFGALQGNKSLPLSAPGEYCAHITATYTDKDGHMWVSPCGMQAWFTIPTDRSWRAAKSSQSTAAYSDRGNTFDEGYITSSTDTEHLIHLNFPYNPATCC